MKLIAILAISLVGVHGQEYCYLTELGDKMFCGNTPRPAGFFNRRDQDKWDEDQEVTGKLRDFPCGSSRESLCCRDPFHSHCSMHMTLDRCECSPYLRCDGLCDFYTTKSECQSKTYEGCVWTQRGGRRLSENEMEGLTMAGLARHLDERMDAMEANQRRLMTSDAAPRRSLADDLRFLMERHSFDDKRRMAEGKGPQKPLPGSPGLSVVEVKKGSLENLKKHAAKIVADQATELAELEAQIAKLEAAEKAAEKAELAEEMPELKAK